MQDMSTAPRASEQPHTQSTTSSSTARPPVELHPTSHLDPGAYVRGTHAIFLGPSVLVHPRAMLASIHGPLIINDGTVIMEKCIIGGPVPDTKDAPSVSMITDSDPVKTVIGASVLVMPHAQVLAGATLHDSCVVESHATVTKTGSIGEHGKVCAGAVMSDSVQDWEVAFGGTHQRRRRKPLEDVEQARLMAMQKDREATMLVLKMSARAPLLKKK